MKKLNSLFTLLLCMSLISSKSFAADTFVFTAIPDQDQTMLIKRFSVLEKYLTAKLGVEVKYIPVKDYAAAVTAFRRGDVQLAWFGGLSGVQARRLVPGAEAIAQGFEDQFFKTYFIAHSSTNLVESDKFPQAIKGKSFTFGSKDSTSGRLMPEYFIQENLKADNLKDSPDHLFSRVGFSGDHSRTIALVESGAYEIGAVNYQVWEKAVADKKVDTSKVNVIWTTPNYPDYHWTIRGDVDKHWGEGFKNRVTATLLAIDQKEILDTIPRSKFIAAKNSDYTMIETVGKEVGLLE
jgi:phosphonate transport system substrate-binding protein